MSVKGVTKPAAVGAILGVAAAIAASGPAVASPKLYLDGDGQYTGQTAQGEEVAIRGSHSGRQFDLAAPMKLSCQQSNAGQVSTFGLTRKGSMTNVGLYPRGTYSVFSHYRRRNLTSNQYHYRLSESFTVSGGRYTPSTRTLSGTLRMVLKVSYDDGRAQACDSGSVSFKAVRSFNL